MNAKKIIVICLILAVLIAGAFAIYLFFSKYLFPEEQATNTPSPSASTQPTASRLADLRFKPISQERILGATLGTDGKTVKYFKKASGHVAESSFDGTEQSEISSVTLSGLVKIIWSPDKEKVIGVFSDNEELKKYFYNYTNNQTASLEAQIGQIAWAPDSKKIVYQYTPKDSEESTISVANPDATGWKNIFKTRLDNLIVEWPVKEKISIRTQISGLAQGIVFSLDSTTGDFTKVLSELYGLSIKWSPKADKILYSATNNRGKNPALWVSDGNGANAKDLKLSGLADKCVWSKDDRTVFCALPQEISANAVWPDDYYKGLIILSDDVYQINLETGEKSKLIGSSSQFGFDAQDLFLSPKEDYLFFTNRSDGLLYSLKI